MYINPGFSLVKFTVDGITCVLNREEANELKQIHKHAKIEPLRKGRSSLRADQKPSACVSIPVEQYLQQAT